MPELHRRKTGRYGWVPDLPDARDHLYAAPPATIVALPPKVDLRAQCPKVYNQGRIGSCTANAIGGAFEFDLLKQDLTDFMPSRLFIYYNERSVEGTVGTDSGAMIRDGIKSVATLGVCTDTEWPYDDTPPAPEDGSWPVGARAGQKPSPQCYTDALRHTGSSYQRVVRSLAQFKDAWRPASRSSSASPCTRVSRARRLPDRCRSDALARRTGSGWSRGARRRYDDADQRFTVRNSWGDQWGDGGYFTMPYAFLTERSLSSDFWTIRVVSSAS